VEKFMAQNGQPDAIVQGVGRKTADGDFVDWQVRANTLKAGEQRTLTQSLRSNLGASKTGVKNVSGTFGHQIAIDAIYGIIVSLLLITIYIAIRFDFKFAMPVILAMLHDILVTVGVYSLTGFEVTTSTVAAVLTVLGYSMYDTVIVFDRVRENIPIMRRFTASKIVNESLAETITRSLNTSFVTLIPVILLFIFGSGTLTDFAFALIVGIASGAYSSIFIAAPILAMLMERQPAFVKRRHDLDRGIAEEPAARPRSLAPATPGAPAPPTTPEPAPPRRRRRRAHGRHR